MAIKAQLDLEFDNAYRAGEVWTELLRLINLAADEFGRKNVAWDLDVGRKSLDNALAERERRALKGEQVVYFLLRKPEVLEWLAGELGYELKARRELTPAEELAALKATLRSQGAIGQTILEMAAGGR